MESANGWTFFPQRRWRIGISEFSDNNVILMASHCSLVEARNRASCEDSVIFSDSRDVHDFLQNEKRPHHIMAVQCNRQPRKEKGKPEWIITYLPLSRRYRMDKRFDYLVFPPFHLTKKSSNACFYATNSVDWAMYDAYLLSQKYGFYQHLRTGPLEHLQLSSFVYRDIKRVYKVDTDLAALTKTKVVDCKFKPEFGGIAPLGEIPSPPSELDEELLDRFCREIESNLSSGEFDESSLKFSGASIGDIVLEPQFARFLTTIRRDIPYQEVSRIVSVNGAVPAVGCLGKCSTITSDGKVRNIYPMHLGYECLLRWKFRRAKYSDSIPYLSDWSYRIPENCTLKEYDIVKCDKQMWPYLIAACYRLNMLWLIPFVRFDGKNYQSLQMPSGIYGTNFLTNWFVCAATKIAGCNVAYVQGDAVFADKAPTFSVNVRENSEPNVLNGFRYSSNTERVYINTHKIKMLRGKRNVPAEHRYAILYASYRYLNAENLKDYLLDLDVYWEGKHYSEWDHIILGHFLNVHSYRPELTIFDGVEACYERSSWDALVAIGAEENPAPNLLRRERVE